MPNGAYTFAMDFDLTDEQKAIQSLAREFAQDEVKPRAEEMDREERFPYELVGKMAELGFMGLPFPEEYGGAGADTVSYALAVMEIARADASTAITMAAHVSLGATPFYLFGTEAQKQKYLVPLARGKMLWGFGLTEPNAGSDAGNVQTKAELRDGKWVINGTKAFITNSGTDISGGTTITAVTGRRPDGSREISNIIVPQETPGFTRSRKYRKMGWRASDTRELSFADAAVPEENLLGPRGEGYRQFLSILDGGRISVAALSIGLAMGAYDEALAYAKERQRLRQADQQVSGDLVQARRHAHRDRAREADDAARRLGEGSAAATTCKRRASPNSSPASSRTASSTKRCRSTAATVSWTSIRSRACIATRRSTRSAKAPTKCSASSSRA